MQSFESQLKDVQKLKSITKVLETTHALLFTILGTMTNFISNLRYRYAWAIEICQHMLADAGPLRSVVTRMIETKVDNEKKLDDIKTLIDSTSEMAKEMKSAAARSIHAKRRERDELQQNMIPSMLEKYEELHFLEEEDFVQFENEVSVFEDQESAYSKTLEMIEEGRAALQLRFDVTAERTEPFARLLETAKTALLDDADLQQLQQEANRARTSAQQLQAEADKCKTSADKYEQAAAAAFSEAQDAKGKAKQWLKTQTVQEQLYNEAKKEAANALAKAQEFQGKASEAFSVVETLESDARAKAPAAESDFSRSTLVEHVVSAKVNYDAARTHYKEASAELSNIYKTFHTLPNAEVSESDRKYIAYEELFDRGGDTLLIKSDELVERWIPEKVWKADQTFYSNGWIVTLADIFDSKTEEELMNIIAILDQRGKILLEAAKKFDRYTREVFRIYRGNQLAIQMHSYLDGDVTNPFAPRSYSDHAV